MLNTFEEYTENLSPKDFPLADILKKYWDNADNESSHVREKISEDTGVRVDKIHNVINYLRDQHDTDYMIVAFGNGYFKTKSFERIKEYWDIRESDVNSRIYRILRSKVHAIKIFGEDSGIQLKFEFPSV